jgi:hemerythrin superfamily protein
MALSSTRRPSACSGDNLGYGGCVVGWNEGTAVLLQRLRLTDVVEEDDMAEKDYTDAIALLKADHRTVEELFDKFESAKAASRKQEIAQKICTELKIHTMIEEEIFYPAFRGKIEDDTLDEAYVEHDGAKVLVNDIEAGSAEEDFYDAKVKVLSEEIKHHVHEEEAQKEGMFAQCRKTDVDLVALRDQMLARKQELMAQTKSGGLPLAKPSAVRLIPA